MLGPTRSMIHLLSASLLLACWLAAGCGNGSDDVDVDAGDTSPTGDDSGASGGTGTTALPSPGPYAVADLAITVTHPDAEPVEYRVVCLGDTATTTGDDSAVDAAAACEGLARPEVVRRLVEGPPADQVCIELYGGPDEAVVRGTIDGEDVDATIDRRNGCAIADWDELLADVLPPSRGVAS